MRALLTTPVTVEEFEKLVLPEDRIWELRAGEIVEVLFPNVTHRLLQNRILHLFEQTFPSAQVLIEYPFQIEETNDKRSADVAVTTRERTLEAVKRGVLLGAPELEVEVLSPSNTVQDMKQYRKLCFRYGTQIFLTVDEEDNTIEVHLQADRADRVLRIGDMLELSLFGDKKAIPVKAIFSGITYTE